MTASPNSAPAWLTPKYLNLETAPGHAVFVIVGVEEVEVGGLELELLELEVVEEVLLLEDVDREVEEDVLLDDEDLVVELVVVVDCRHCEYQSLE